MSFQTYFQYISGWEDNDGFRPYNKQESMLLTYQVMTDYYHGQIRPMLNATYDTIGTWNVRPSVKWEPNHKWFFEMTMMTFLGKHTSLTPFSNYMVENGSETSFRIGYRF
jgi:hypothetical protein